jgi:hypothetical protein
MPLGTQKVTTLNRPESESYLQSCLAPGLVTLVGRPLAYMYNVMVQFVFTT